MTDGLKERIAGLAGEVVHVGQFDYASVFRERRFRVPQFLDWAREPRFANVVAYWGISDSLFGGTSYFTENLEIDPSSIRRYPAEPQGVAVIAELSGEAKELMPRQVLRRQIERAAALGYRVDAAFEFELIVLEESENSVRSKGFESLAKFAPDNKCWSGTTAATHAEFVSGLEAEIVGYDVGLYALGVELGPGCLEATLAAQEGLKAADDACFFRLASRSYARRHGKTISFMPFLGNDYPGIGGHVTLSLKDKKSGANLFSSPDGRTNDLAKTFIAGMMDIVPQAFALCTSSVNAYRRLAPGSWAPKSLTWQEYTFTTAVRSVPSAGDSARLEFRVPPADCNPYLTLALMLAAGLDGIERKLAAAPAAQTRDPDFVPEGAKRFPRDLYEATELLRASDAAKRLFGEPFVANFVTACMAEHASLTKAVSGDERARYLEG